jgi:hypothetical protein
LLTEGSLNYEKEGNKKRDKIEDTRHKILDIRQKIEDRSQKLEAIPLTPFKGGLWLTHSFYPLSRGEFSKRLIIVNFKLLTPKFPLNILSIHS